MISVGECCDAGFAEVVTHEGLQFHHDLGERFFLAATGHSQYSF